MLLDVRSQAVRRSFVVVAAAILMSGPTGAGAAPTQEGPGEDERDSATDRALVDVDAADADLEELAGAIEATQANVVAQLEQLELAQAAIAAAESELADAQSVVQDTELRIEELTIRSDAVVVETFVNAPTNQGVEVFSADTVEEATIKQAILDVHAAASADALAELEEEREALEEQMAVQEGALAGANEARGDAQAALADLEAAVSQHTQFVLDVRERLESDSTAALDETDPDVAAQILNRQAEIQGEIDEAAAAAEYARAMEALAEAERRREEQGIWECPVQGNVSFTDTWGAARSGGRSHKGTDMMASTGTPTVAPVSGNVEHRSTSLGGLSWYVYGDDGNTYYGTHLSSYENVGAGHVDRGTVIGYVGSSGNASSTAPHLHFEYHPGGGSAVNPYERLVTAC